LTDADKKRRKMKRRAELAMLKSGKGRVEAAPSRPRTETDPLRRQATAPLLPSERGLLAAGVAGIPSGVVQSAGAVPLAVGGGPLMGSSAPDLDVAGGPRFATARSSIKPTLMLRESGVISRPANGSPLAPVTYSPSVESRADKLFVGPRKFKRIAIGNSGPKHKRRASYQGTSGVTSRRLSGKVSPRSKRLSERNPSTQARSDGISTESVIKGQLDDRSVSEVFVFVDKKQPSPAGNQKRSPSRDKLSSPSVQQGPVLQPEESSKGLIL